jgi:hypothetical protein
MARKKQLTAAQLLNYLIMLEESGTDLRKVKVNYRKDYDSDVKKITSVEEDLYDAKTNSKLESIILVKDGE